jgi:hypothetical protein
MPLQPCPRTKADILTDLASHSAISVCAKLELFAADQLPGGRNTTTEVTMHMRCGPACMTTFPDMPSSNNISEGILGMTKAAHRKTPNVEARSTSGEDDMATKWCCINHSHHDPACAGECSPIRDGQCKMHEPHQGQPHRDGNCQIHAFPRPSKRVPAERGDPDREHPGHAGHAARTHKGRVRCPLAPKGRQSAHQEASASSTGTGAEQVGPLTDAPKSASAYYRLYLDSLGRLEESDA